MPDPTQVHETEPGEAFAPPSPLVSADPAEPVVGPDIEHVTPPPRSPARRRLMLALATRLRALRGKPLLNRVALVESWQERSGGHPVDVDHTPHLHAALEWLVRSQDATPDDGFSRGYSLTWNGYLHQHGWQPSYPETTGYLIPTLYEAARVCGMPELELRATRAARWEIVLQLPSGAVRGGVVGQRISPAVFNTGQVIFGWLSAFEETGGTRFADAARRAASYLVDVQEDDGHWRTGNSRFARSDSTLYNARTAWALAEAGRRLHEPTYIDAAARNLRAVAAQQYGNGWLPGCCLNDPHHPLLHTIAYAIRGLLEGGRVLEDDVLMCRAELAAAYLAECVRDDGWMAGRFSDRWTPAVSWSCLAGEAQMANIWLRLAQLTGHMEWLDVAQRVLRFLKSTQNRTSTCDGVRGAIKGSSPVNGGYATYEVLSWATKFFVDALLRDAQIRSGARAPRSRAFELA